MNTALKEKNMTKYKAAFKETYGVEYNEKNINEFYKNPTPQNRAKAFGTSRLADIQGLVANYNESQDMGGEVVKGVAVGAAAVATGGAGLTAVAIAGGYAMGAEIIDDATRGAKTENGGYSLNQVGDNISDMGDMEHAVKYGKTFATGAASAYVGGKMGEYAGKAILNKGTSIAYKHTTKIAMGDKVILPNLTKNLNKASTVSKVGETMVGETSAAATDVATDLITGGIGDTLNGSMSESAGSIGTELLTKGLKKLI